MIGTNQLVDEDYERISQQESFLILLEREEELDLLRQEYEYNNREVQEGRGTWFEPKLNITTKLYKRTESSGERVAQECEDPRNHKSLSSEEIAQLGGFGF